MTLNVQCTPKAYVPVPVGLYSEISSFLSIPRGFFSVLLKRILDFIQYQLSRENAIGQNSSSDSRVIILGHQSC